MFYLKEMGYMLINNPLVLYISLTIVHLCTSVDWSTIIYSSCSNVSFNLVRFFISIKTLILFGIVIAYFICSSKFWASVMYRKQKPLETFIDYISQNRVQFSNFNYLETKTNKKKCSDQDLNITVRNNIP